MPLSHLDCPSLCRRRAQRVDNGPLLIDVIVPAPDQGGPPCNRQGSPKSLPQGEIKQGPILGRGACSRLVESGIEYPRRVIGGEGHRHVLQGKGEAVSQRFDKGLFPGPTPEKRRSLFGRWECLESQEFIGAANAFGQPRIIQGVPVFFKIDADFEIAGNGIDGPLPGMRHVEMQRLPRGVSQERFSEGTRFKMDVTGRLPEVAGENMPQDASCRGKASPVSGAFKPLRAFLLVGTQGFLVHLKTCQGYVYNRPPHVDMPRRKQMPALGTVLKERKWRG